MNPNEASSADQNNPLVTITFDDLYDIEKVFIQNRSKPRGVTPGYTGLMNMGNTCFMNATLQTLLNTPGLVEMFSEKRILPYINKSHRNNGAICAIFSALMDSFWSANFGAISPKYFLETFAYLINSGFSNGKQHDAQEFQTFLLEAMIEETKISNSNEKFEQNYNGQNLETDANDYLNRYMLSSNSIVEDLFRVTIVSQIICSICRTQSVSFESTTQIMLSLEFEEVDEEDEENSLEYFLQRNFETTFFDWNCPTCQKLQRAKHRTKIWRLPRILIINVKRFTRTEGDEYVKNEKYIDFFIRHMNMDYYLHDESPEENTFYDLYAVVNHSGTLTSGHYTTLIRNCHTFEWLRFNDGNVTTITDVDDIWTNKATTFYYINKRRSNN